MKTNPLVSKTILSNPFHSKTNLSSPMKKDSPVSKYSSNSTVSKTEFSSSLIDSQVSKDPMNSPVSKTKLPNSPVSKTKLSSLLDYPVSKDPMNSPVSEIKLSILTDSSVSKDPMHSPISKTNFSSTMNSPVSKYSMNNSVSKTKLSYSTPSFSAPSSSSSNSRISSSCCSNSETDESPLSSQCFSIQDVKYQFPTKCISMPNSHSHWHRSLAVLSGHAGSVSCLAVCGEFILSASQGKDIIVWQQPDLRFFAKFGHGDGSVKALVSIGNKVFTAHQDSRIRVWKVSRSSENVFKLDDTLPTTKDYWGKFMKQSNYVQTRRHHKRLWIEHADSISCLSVNNGLIYSGSWDKTLKVWRLSDLKCLESIKAHDDAINGLVSCKGVVYSASADGKIKAWRKEEKKDSHCLKGVLEGHKDVSLNSVIVSDDGKWVYGGGSDGFVIGWEGNGSYESWKLVSETKAHDMAVLCMCLMGEFLCSGSADKNIGIWKREAFGKLCKVGVISGHEGPVKCLQASSSNRIGGGFMLYSGSLDRSVRVWWVPRYSSNNNTQVEEDNSTTLSTMNQSIISC